MYIIKFKIHITVVSDTLPYELMMLVGTMSVLENIDLITERIPRGLTCQEFVDYGPYKDRHCSGPFFVGGLEIRSQGALNDFTGLSSLACNCHTRDISLGFVACSPSTIEPGTFENIPSLRFLGLEGYKLTRISPSAIKNLEGLIEIAINCTEITHIEEGIIQNLPALKTIYLSCNSELTSIHPGAFQNVPALEKVRFYYCPLLTENTKQNLKQSYPTVQFEF